MRETICVVALVVAACGSKSTTGGVDATGSAAIDAPGSGAIDAPAGGSGVACGSAQTPTTCALPGMACCDFAPGSGTDFCYAPGGSCSGASIQCDGPEDCTNTGQVCCYEQNSGSVCLGTGLCQASGATMCHLGDDTPCGTGNHCCELQDLSGAQSSGAYGVCLPGSCPT